jgi:hypothetical protein
MESEMLPIFQVFRTVQMAISAVAANLRYADAPQAFCCCFESLRHSSFLAT